MTLPVGEHTYRTYVHEPSWVVEQTRYPVRNVRVCRAENSADANEAGYATVGSQQNEGKWTLFTVSTIPESWYTTFWHVWRKLIAAGKSDVNRRVGVWLNPVYVATLSSYRIERYGEWLETKAYDGLNKHKIRTFHGLWLDPVDEYMYGAIGEVEQTPFLYVSLIFQGHETMQINKIFEFGRSRSRLNQIILTGQCDELLHGQAKLTHGHTQDRRMQQYLKAKTGLG